MNRNQESTAGLVTASSLASALISSNPAYQDADRVRRMVAEARTKVAPLTPTRTGR
jgi:hypothetical protein